LTRREVRIEGGALRDGQERVRLLSGEVHYWRLQRDQWPRVLETVKELGFRLISTYVPWEHHEVAPGAFDFTGRTWPSRDLAGFLELVDRTALRILLRPGPYIYSEWRNAGVPDRVVRYHRSHPAFLKEARAYLKEVVRVVEPYLATRGGPVIMVQVDNELDPWEQCYGDQLGLWGGEGLFQEFLRTRYSTVERLNQSWGTQFTNFRDAHATAAPSDSRTEGRRRYLDFVRFRRHYTTELARTLCEAFRKVGIDTPLYVNTYASVTVQDWISLDKAADLVGYDTYPTAHFQHRPNEHRDFMEIARYAGSVCRLPFIAELECGVWHGWHYHTGVLDRKHLRLTACSAIAGGVVGWNWYMLVDRDNWYMSPINEWGAKRPELAEEVEALVRAYDQLDPPSLERVTSTCLTWSSLHRSAKLDDPTCLPRKAMYEAGLDYMFLDLAVGKVCKPLILYDGTEWLPSGEQERLLVCIEEGSHLVLFQLLPLRDEDGRETNVLGLPVPTGKRASGWLDVILGNETVRVKSSSLLWDREEWEPFAAAAAMRPAGEYTAEMERHVRLALGRQFTVGWTKDCGKGRITVLGLEPSALLIKALHRAFGITLPPHSDEDSVTVVTFTGKRGLFMVVVNVCDRARQVAVRLPWGLLPSPDVAVSRVLGQGSQYLTVRDTEEAVLTAALDSYDAAILKISPIAKQG
jgi:hypothetical protein